MAKQPQHMLPQRSKARLLLLVFFLLFLYIVLPRLGNFSQSFEVLKDADLLKTALAGGFIVISYVLAMMIYQLLSVKKLQPVRTLHVQFASAFANRLLPAGLGGLSLNIQYLRKSGHTTAQSVAIAGTNNMIGILGHVLLFLVALAITGSELWERFDTPVLPQTWWVVLIAVAVIGTLAFIFKGGRVYLRNLGKETAGYLASYRRRPLRLAVAIGYSICLTACYVAALYFCVDSLGLELPVWTTFIVFTVGMITGTLTPTPGGLGGAEAGMVAGFIAYGVQPAVALAAVLLFRLITYWLPLLPGFIFFLRVEHKYS